MRHSWLFALATLACSFSRAAVPPMSPADLRKDAQLVIVGSVESSKQFGDVNTPSCSVILNYDINVHVAVVEKGSLPSSQKSIIVHGWSKVMGTGTPTNKPGTPPPPVICMPGPTGIYGISAASKGQRVRLYLRNNGDNVDIVEPNGIEFLPSAQGATHVK